MKFAKEAGLEPRRAGVAADPKLAGRVAIPDIGFTYKQVYAAINLINAGNETDFSGSLKWLATLKNPIIYGEFPTLQTRFNSGEIWAIIGLSGYVARWPNRSIGFVLPPVRDKRGVLFLSSLEVAKGTQKTELALQFIDAWLSDEAQTALAQQIGYSPPNLVAAAAAAKDEKLAPIIASSPEVINALYVPDWEKVNAVYPEWVEQWNRAIRR